MNSRSARKCLSEREVEEFLFNRLSGITREVVEEHLLACQRCLEKVEAEDEYVKAVRAAARTLESEDLERAFQEPPAPAPVKPAWAARRWGLALGTAAVVMVAVFLQYRPGPALTETEIALSVERSSFDDIPEAAANQPLRLTPDLTGLGPAASLEWSVVDSRGNFMQTMRFDGAPGTPGIKLPRGLRAGTYWVRIQREDGKLLREFWLRVR